MTTASLDSFQLIIGLYLLYVAIKGHGQMYRFGDLSEADQERVRRPLRLLYLAAALVALGEFGVCSLQNSMFTRSVLEDGSVSIAQNFTVEALPFLTYGMLSAVSTVMTILVIAILAGGFIWLRTLSRRNRAGE